jgi:polyphosphate kinase 2
VEVVGVGGLAGLELPQAQAQVLAAGLATDARAAGAEAGLIARLVETGIVDVGHRGSLGAGQAERVAGAWDHSPVPETRELNLTQYAKELLRLQTELVYMQEWIVERGMRLVVLFEGRDTAGKDGVIKRITAFLNPRTCRVIAVPTPGGREQSQWFFQRYIAHLPAAGEIALFDRSWYNRAGVEHVMGYCTPEQYEEFLRFCPLFEEALRNDGIILLKYWLSVSDEEQERRFKKRLSDPRKRWKFSPTDLQARARWVDYAEAKDRMFAYTDTEESPWHVVEADDKRTARLNLIADLLTRVPYEHLDTTSHVKLPPRQERRYLRPPKRTEHVVASRYVVRSD